MRQCFLCGASLTQGHEVTFIILSQGEKKRSARFHVADMVRGEEISKNLGSGPLFQVLYNKKAGKMGVKNLSKSPWTVIHPDKTESVCNSGGIQALEDGMQIRLIYKVAHLNVAKIV